MVAGGVDRVVEPDLGEHGSEIGDLSGAGEVVATAATYCRRAFGVLTFVVREGEIFFLGTAMSVSAWMVLSAA